MLNSLKPGYLIYSLNFTGHNIPIASDEVKVALSVKKFFDFFFEAGLLELGRLQILKLNNTSYVLMTSVDELPVLEIQVKLGRLLLFTKRNGSKDASLDHNLLDEWYVKTGVKWLDAHQLPLTTYNIGKYFVYKYCFGTNSDDEMIYAIQNEIDWDITYRLMGRGLSFDMFTAACQSIKLWVVGMLENFESDEDKKRKATKHFSIRDINSI